MAESFYQEVSVATGLPGTSGQSRLVGTVSGTYPSTGTFSTGDYVVDVTGGMWVCTASGTPGTWISVGTPPTAQIAGKNKILNGDFNIWQRGAGPFKIAASGSMYTADQWYFQQSTGLTTQSISQQTFTPGTAPVPGYESQYFLRMSLSGTQTGYPSFIQKIEDVRTFAGQTVTLSFWAKASASGIFNQSISQNFGTGGSSQSYSSVCINQNNSFPTLTIGTTWQRYSLTWNISSVSGQTIGPNSALIVQSIYWNPGMTLPATIDIWGVQLEAGPVATEFTTATANKQGELAACQRYFYGNTFGTQLTLTAQLFSGVNYSTVYMLPVPMRILPSITFGLATYNDSNAQWFNTTTSGPYTTGIAVQSNQGIRLQYSNASLFGLVNFNYLQASAEL